MNELAPGMMLEVLKDQRLRESYAHVSGILAAVERGEARRAALTAQKDSTTMRTGTALTGPRTKEDE